MVIHLKQGALIIPEVYQHLHKIHPKFFLVKAGPLGTYEGADVGEMMGAAEEKGMTLFEFLAEVCEESLIGHDKDLEGNEVYDA